MEEKRSCVYCPFFVPACDGEHVGYCECDTCPPIYDPEAEASDCGWYPK